MTSGIVLVDKPSEWTSHDVVARARRLAGTRKVGHAGTLDPMATGLLILGIDQGTKLLTYLVGESKRYVATMRLGIGTVTDDAEGESTEVRGVAGATLEDLKRGIAGLTGTIDQVPSAVSAIKVDGKRSYARVRAGERVELKARPVTVSLFEITGLNETIEGGVPVWDVDVTVECSSGTYIRALARDLGEFMGSGGHLTMLRRERIGPYRVEDASDLDRLAQQFTIMPMADAARARFQARQVTQDEAKELSYGRSLELDPRTRGSREEPVAAFAGDGTLLALLEDRKGRSRPLTVFAAA